jgi:hypothetical protein
MIIIRNIELLLFIFLMIQNSAYASGLTILCENKKFIASAEVASFDDQKVEAQMISVVISVSEKSTQKLIFKKSLPGKLLSWPKGTELFDGATGKRSKTFRLGVSSYKSIGVVFVKDGSKTIFSSNENNCSLKTSQ